MFELVLDLVRDRPLLAGFVATVWLLVALLEAQSRSLLPVDVRFEVYVGLSLGALAGSVMMLTETDTTTVAALWLAVGAWLLGYDCREIEANAD